MAKREIAELLTSFIRDVSGETRGTIDIHLVRQTANSRNKVRPNSRPELLTKIKIPIHKGLNHQQIHTEIREKITDLLGHESLDEHTLRNKPIVSPGKILDRKKNRVLTSMSPEPMYSQLVKKSVEDSWKKIQEVEVC